MRAFAMLFFIFYSLVIFSDSSDFLNSKLSVSKSDKIIAEKIHPIIKHGINENGNIYKLSNINQALIIESNAINIITLIIRLFIILWIRI